LQGVISFQDEAMPICGLCQSASPMPTARSMPREVMASMPSVTTRERGLMSTSTSAATSDPGVSSMFLRVSASARLPRARP
jgi:hypothetical protein